MTHGVMARACALVIGAGAAGATPIDDYSLIVFGNGTSTSEVEGRALFGGNLGGPASNYGTHLTPASSYLGLEVLGVGGNLQTSNINMAAGNLHLGGTQSGNVNHNGGGHTVADPTVASRVNARRNVLENASAFLSGMSATNTVTLPGLQPAGVVFNAVPDSNGVAVFHVSGADLFGNNKVQQMDINLNGATSVIINVSGLSIGWNAGNFVGNFANDATRSIVLWNFYEAQTLNFMSGRRLDGALLAPDAHLAFNGLMAGSVAVKSLEQFGEVHLPTYTGFLPAPGAAAVLGLAGLCISRRRR